MTTPCAIEGCVAEWGEHRPHCGAIAPTNTACAGSPCVLPRGHASPSWHVYGTPGVLDELSVRRRSVHLKIGPV